MFLVASLFPKWLRFLGVNVKRSSGILIWNVVFRGVYVVSDNHNFVARQSPGDGYGYRATGDLSHFVYCNFQKIRKIESLPFVEKWETYMLLSSRTTLHLLKLRIEEELFLLGTRVPATIEKMLSSYLKKEFRTSGRRFLEEFCRTISSTVAPSSKLGRGISCFSRKYSLGAMTNPPFSSLGSYWIDLLNVAGREALRLRLAKPRSSRLSGSSASWSAFQQGGTLMYGTSWPTSTKDWIQKSPISVPVKFRITLGCTSV